MDGLHIALAPEILGYSGSFPITNTLVTTWVVVFVLAVIGVLVGQNVKMVPGKVQTFFESLFEYVLSYMEETLESRKLAQRYFPLITTIFIFILFSNWFGLLPGVASIGIEHGAGEHTALTPFLYPASTDLNLTLALAIIVFFVIEIAGIMALGFLKYAGKFVNFKSPLAFAIGFIELFSELARLVSFSFRLFGNIFAGKVLLLVVIAFVPYVVPVPLMLFEIFVGFIQAAIFALLTLFFIKIAVTEAH